MLTNIANRYPFKLLFRGNETTKHRVLHGGENEQGEVQSDDANRCSEIKILNKGYKHEEDTRICIVAIEVESASVCGLTSTSVNVTTMLSRERDAVAKHEIGHLLRARLNRASAVLRESKKASIGKREATCGKDSRDDRVCHLGFNTNLFAMFIQGRRKVKCM